MFEHFMGHVVRWGNAIGRRYRNRDSWPLARYDSWRKINHTPSSIDRKFISEQIADGGLPSLHVLWVFDEEDFSRVSEAIATLLHQAYQSWTASLITPSGSVGASYLPPADSRIALRGPDFRYEGGCPVLFIHGPVLLDEFALYHFACARVAGAFVAYCDEDRQDAHGRWRDPVFKGNYAPVDLGAWLPLGACFLLAPGHGQSSRLIEAWSAGTEALRQEKQELLLRHAPGDIVHIPYVLFTHRDGSAPDFRPPENMLTLPVRDGFPTVSIIIPTRDRLDLLKPCIESIEAVTRYPRDHVQIIVADNQSVEPASLAYIADIEREGIATIVRDDAPFNYSRINNQAARLAAGEVLVFLNNDTIIDRPEWLELLVAHAIRPEVGVVGGKLLYPDRTVQHAGVVLGVQALAIHAFRFLAENDGGYLGLATRTHAVSAVTAACAAMRREAFFDIGGFDEDLEVAFNDVALCAEAMRKGWTNITLGQTLVIHLESKSRGLDDTLAKKTKAQLEGRIVRARHDPLFRADKFYNPNLCVRRPYHLAMVSRRARPWLDYRRARTTHRRILILSDDQRDASGRLIAVVAALRGAGHDVILGGRNRHLYGEDVPRIRVGGVRGAARYAFSAGIDCIVALSSPYFSIGRHLAAGQVFAVARQAASHPGDRWFHTAARRREAEHLLAQAVADIVIAGPDDIDRLVATLALPVSPEQAHVGQ